MQVLASQLHFLANKNAELSDPTVYSLYCGFHSIPLIVYDQIEGWQIFNFFSLS